MKNGLFALLLLAMLVACKNNSKQETTSEETTSDAEWVVLFDGSSLDNWRNFNADTLGSAWQIEDGALTLTKENTDNGRIIGGGDIVTKEMYDNFELEMDWKIDSCGNSGIMHHVAEGEGLDYAWFTGPEMQILDDDCHPDAKLDRHRAGDLYDMIEPEEKKYNPAGEWNHIRIKSVDGHTQYYLNGELTASFTMWIDDWEDMKQNSKWKDYPDFGTKKNGHIALQDHNDQVWFKDIKIRRL